MPIDFTGLGALASGGAAGYQAGENAQLDQQSKRIAIQRAIQQQQDEESARRQAGFAGGALYGGAQPQQVPMPGATPMPQQGGPMAGSAFAGPGAAQAMPQLRNAQGAMPGGGGPQGAPGGPPGAPGGQPAQPPMQPQQPPQQPLFQTVQQLAAAIKQKHPDISDQDLFGAVQQASALLFPQGKMELQYLTAQMKVDQGLRTLEERAREADQRNDTAQSRIQMQQGLMDLRMQIAKLQETGKNDRQSTDLQARADRLQATLDAKGKEDQKKIDAANYRTELAQTGGTKGQAQLVKWKVSQINQQMTQFRDNWKIQMKTGSVFDDPEYKKLTEARQSLYTKLDKLLPDTPYKTRAGVPLPEGSEDGAPDAGGDAGAPAGPKKGDVVDGYTFKGGDPGKPENWDAPKKDPAAPVSGRR